MECGVKKWDDLPGRVGYIDVDVLRFHLVRFKEKMKYCQEEINAIEKELEGARKNYTKQNGRRSWFI